MIGSQKSKTARVIKLDLEEAATSTAVAILGSNAVVAADVAQIMDAAAWLA